MATNVVIINTGCANISSVLFAVKRLGTNVEVSDDPNVIRAADKVLLPGVGSANAAMQSIKEKQLVNTIQALEQPVLGICLGMQLMVQRSEEALNDTTTCLELIPGEVKRMVVGELRLPHMGWNNVVPKKDNLLFDGIPSGTHFYFVHSYSIADYEYTLASCEYGQPFSAAIQKANLMGVQFHPERSGDAGAQLLENFVRKL